jgi:DNA-binding NtrC family response regulator
MKNILIVDDDAAFLSSVATALNTADDRYRVYTAENAEHAVMVLKTAAVDLMIADLDLPLMEGVELVLHAAEEHPELPVIAVSSDGWVNAFARTSTLQELGAKPHYYFDKPLDYTVLSSAIHSLLKEHTGEHISV